MNIKLEQNHIRAENNLHYNSILVANFKTLDKIM